MRNKIRLLTPKSAPQLLLLLGVVLVIMCGPVFAQAEGYTKLSADDLKKLVAPVALYPDDLLSNVLTAATNPIDVVQAARYLKDKGGKVDQVPDNGWDPGLQALLRFPDVLSMMDEKIDWTTQLGAAFMNQREELMTAVQAYRNDARGAGVLNSNDKQKVVVEKEVVKIVPANPEVVYVPVYSPDALYISDPGSIFVSFVAGVVVGSWFRPWYCDWDNYYVCANYPILRNCYPYYYGCGYYSHGGYPYWRPHRRTICYHNSGFFNHPWRPHHNGYYNPRPPNSGHPQPTNSGHPNPGNTPFNPSNNHPGSGHPTGTPTGLIPGHPTGGGTSPNPNLPVSPNPANPGNPGNSGAWPSNPTKPGSGGNPSGPQFNPTPYSRPSFSNPSSNGSGRPSYERHNRPSYNSSPSRPSHTPSSRPSFNSSPSRPSNGSYSRPSRPSFNSSPRPSRRSYSSRSGSSWNSRSSSRSSGGGSFRRSSGGGFSHHGGGHKGK